MLEFNGNEIEPVDNLSDRQVNGLKSNNPWTKMRFRIKWTECELFLTLRQITYKHTFLKDTY